MLDMPKETISNSHAIRTAAYDKSLPKVEFKRFLHFETRLIEQIDIVPLHEGFSQSI